MNPKSESITAAEQPGVAEQSAAEEVVSDHVLWDQLGIFGSALCVAHCLATPLIVGYLSAAGLGFLGGEIVHKLLAAPLLFIALLAFVPGYRRHGDVRILSAGLVGIGLLLITIFALEPFVAHGVETTLTILGSVVLIGAHIANWRRGERAAHQSATDTARRR